MTISFDNMSSWVIVALVSRVARHIQEFARESDRTVVNDAIQVAEEAARRGHCDKKIASELSHKAREVSDVAKKDNQLKACRAALCAAEAATAACMASDRQSLIQTAERALECAREFREPDGDRALEEEIQRLGRLGDGLSDDAPAPPEMLNFVHQQAVHEAGHAVAACLLKIRFMETKIIYDAGVDPVINPIDNPIDVTNEERIKYHIFYAAGAAAEDVVFGTRQEWRNSRDRCNHGKGGGIDFDEDARKVRQIAGFNSDVLKAVAFLLERRNCFQMEDAEFVQVFRNHQICIWWLF